MSTRNENETHPCRENLHHNIEKTDRNPYLRYAELFKFYIGDVNQRSYEGEYFQIFGDKLSSPKRI